MQLQDFFLQKQENLENNVVKNIRCCPTLETNDPVSKTTDISQSQIVFQNKVETYIFTLQPIRCEKIVSKSP